MPVPNQKEANRLGLTGRATESEIKQAYRDLSKVWRPDRFNENDQRLRRKAEERMQEINDAYGHLLGHYASARL